MPMDPEDRKQAVKLREAKRLAQEEKAKLPPVIKMPYDAENAFLSKKEFVDKYAKKKQEKAEAEAYIARKRKEKEDGLQEEAAEVEDDGPAENKEPKDEAPKRGRPKRID